MVTAGAVIAFPAVEEAATWAYAVVVAMHAVEAVMHAEAVATHAVEAVMHAEAVATDAVEVAMPKVVADMVAVAMQEVVVAMQAEDTVAADIGRPSTSQNYGA
jgi:hypothetical protein